MSTQIYFIISTFIVFMCIICSNIFEKLLVIQHYQKQRTMSFKLPLPGHQNAISTSLSRMGSAVEPNEQPKFWDAIRNIRWTAIRIFMIYVVSLSIFPGYLTEDVKSQFFRDWYPILLITTYNLMDFLGKSLTAIYIPKKITVATWACFARLLLYPLFIVFEHGPKSLRSESPVVFLTATLRFTNGYLTSVLMILAPKLVPVEESETVGIVMSLFLVMGLATGSVLGWLWNM
ncbi:equilibrative nucleotide transporter 8-like [Camellia sinensis]|nr:equilibrative nucleotide transporter 8-like [Camellia sinensis]